MEIYVKNFFDYHIFSFCFSVAILSNTSILPILQLQNTTHDVTNRLHMEYLHCNTKYNTILVLILQYKLTKIQPH